MYYKTNIYIGSTILVYFLLEDFSPGTFGHVIILYFISGLLVELKSIKFID